LVHGELRKRLRNKFAQLKAIAPIAIAFLIAPAMNYPSLPHSTFSDICQWLLRRYLRFRVTGDSMMPTLTPAQEVLIDPSAYRLTAPEPGDIVVACHPHQPDLRIVKRILFVETGDRCYLQGDNPHSSSDSRQFGLVPLSQIEGKVLCLLP